MFLGHKMGNYQLAPFPYSNTRDQKSFIQQLSQVTAKMQTTEKSITQATECGGQCPTSGGKKRGPRPIRTRELLEEYSFPIWNPAGLHVITGPP